MEIKPGQIWFRRMSSACTCLTVIRYCGVGEFILENCYGQWRVEYAELLDLFEYIGEL